MTRRPLSGLEPTVWQRRTYAFGRYAVIAIPVFALIAGLLPRSAAAFSVDPAVYAHYAAHGRWQPREAAVTIFLAATGLASIVGLAALLWRGRATRLAVSGLVLGLVGSITMISIVGSTVIREDRLRHALLAGDWSHLALNARETGSVATSIVAWGALLLTIGWILLGVGIMRTAGLNRADGPLVIIAAPLMFLGGMIAHVLPTMGSFLLLAAGLGIVFTAERVAVGGDMTPWQLRRARASRDVVESTLPVDRAPGLAGALGLARPSVVVADGSVSSDAAEEAVESVRAVVPVAAVVSITATDAVEAADGHVDDKSGDRVDERNGDAPAGMPAAGEKQATQGPVVDHTVRPFAAGKSVRDFLRGAASSWPVSRSRSNARPPGGDPARANRSTIHEPTTPGTPATDATGAVRPVIGKRFARSIGNAARAGRMPPLGASGRNGGRPRRPAHSGGRPRITDVSPGTSDLATPTSPAGPQPRPRHRRPRHRRPRRQTPAECRPTARQPMAGPATRHRTAGRHQTAGQHPTARQTAGLRTAGLPTADGTRRNSSWVPSLVDGPSPVDGPACGWSSLWMVRRLWMARPADGAGVG